MSNLTPVFQNLRVRGNNVANAVLVRNGGVVLESNLSVQGAVTLESTLSVGGDFVLGNDLVVVSSLSVAGATTLGSTLSVEGATALASTLSVGGDVTVASNLSVADAVVLGSTLSVVGAVDVLATLSVGNDVTLASNLSVADAVGLGSTLSVAGNVHTAGDLRINDATDGLVHVGTLTATLDDNDGTVSVPATSGVITMNSIITAGSSHEFTVTNSTVDSASIILISVESEQDNADGIPCAAAFHTIVDGTSFKVQITNQSSADTVAAPKIHFLILNHN